MPDPETGLPQKIQASAPAKINLSLHVEGRRGDGYHELSGLVAFSDIADELVFTPSGAQNTVWSLDVLGPFATELQGPGDNGGDNLVLKTVRLYGKQSEQSGGGLIELHKNLPVAAGLGGGSSDAAATLNVMQKLCSFSASALRPDQLMDVAVRLGADVPMCLTPTAQMIGGIGEIRQPVVFPVPLPAVLVNPGVAVSTMEVFHRLQAGELAENHQVDVSIPETKTPEALIGWLRHQRNDLQSPALQIAPVIQDVLEAISANKNCALSRMSGSGATCFGLYETEDKAHHAAREIKRDYPDWWVAATLLN